MKIKNKYNRKKENVYKFKRIYVILGFEKFSNYNLIKKKFEIYFRYKNMNN